MKIGNEGVWQVVGSALIMYTAIVVISYLILSNELFIVMTICMGFATLAISMFTVRQELISQGKW